jgi:gliding motility-associated-like protein
VVNVFPSDSNHLEVSFSEPVKDPERLADMVNLSGKRVASSVMKDPAGKEFSLLPEEPFIKGSVYSFNISTDMTDYAGNKPEISEFEFGLPELPEKYDIVFNELLFNPLPGDADYIELTNNSVKPVDASWLCVASKDDATGKMSGSVHVSEKNILIMPGKYYAFTTDRPAIVNRYYSGDKYSIFEAGSLPSMPDDGGHLILMGRELDVLDEVRYDDDMHFSLLSEAEGVSLEKINPRGSSLDENNWHSSSGSSGWGTPGRVNSVFSTMPLTDDRLWFSSTRITPNNDGTEDVLTIKMNLAGIGNVVTVMIFDENGTLVRRLAENLLADPETYLSWDGTDNNGSLLPAGIYIFLVTMFNDTGKTQKWKRVCTVIR